MEEKLQVIEIGKPDLSVLHESEQNTFYRVLFETLLNVKQNQSTENN